MRRDEPNEQQRIRRVMRAQREVSTRPCDSVASGTAQDWLQPEAVWQRSFAFWARSFMKIVKSGAGTAALLVSLPREALGPLDTKLGSSVCDDAMASK